MGILGVWGCAFQRGVYHYPADGFAWKEGERGWIYLYINFGEDE
jgi:hypothetical protein